MKILCNQKKLSNAITNAQRAINNKTTTELLKGVLLTAKGDTLTVTGYDDVISIQTSIEAQVKKEGSVVVNSRLLGDIIRKLPDSFVSVEIDENYNVFINCMNSRFKIKGVNADDFPRQPEVNTGTMIRFNQSVMKTMIKQTVFATATEPVNPTLAGELFEANGSCINMVAVDGYRLAVRKSFMEEDVDMPVNVIIPGTTLIHLNSLLNEDKDFFIGIDEKNIIFKLDNTTIVARLIEGNFTKYEKLLPKEYATKVNVETRKLQEAIERAALLFTSDKNNLIKISVSDNIMVITSNNENGNAYEELNIELEGEELEIAFNSRYFLEGIKNIESEYISIEFGGAMHPCIIRSLDSTEYTYLLLPVRVGN